MNRFERITAAVLSGWTVPDSVALGHDPIPTRYYFSPKEWNNPELMRLLVSDEQLAEDRRLFPQS
jgi:hypothetical protein